MSLDYHFTVDQEVGSATHAFFGFNGTAGVWRIAAINEAGGWKDRTRVEDMDLAEVHVPIWGAVYIPSIITILNSVGTPRSIHILFYWILFENVISLHRTKATLIGLLEYGRANEWIVTEKLGDSVNNNKNKTGDASKKTNVKTTKKTRSKFLESECDLSSNPELSSWQSMRRVVPETLEPSLPLAAALLAQTAGEQEKQDEEENKPMQRRAVEKEKQLHSAILIP